MRRFLVLLLLVASTAATAQPFQVDTLGSFGPVENRINLVFLPDGYLAEDMDKFARDVSKTVDALFDTEPFRQYQSFFNVISIQVPSNVRGASRNPENLIDNYFGSTYGYAGIERLLVPTRSDRVVEVVTKYFPNYDQVFVLVNDEKYGGSGGWIATSSTHASAGEIAIHEIGHSMIGLSDEYWAGEEYAGETANMTANGNPKTVKWKNWVGDESVGVYAFAEDPEWHKPHENCKMQVLGAPFCAVCREAIVGKFHGFVSAIEAANSEEVAPGEVAFAAELRVPSPNTTRSYVILGNDTIKENSSTVSVDLNALSEGAHSLTLHVFDTTVFSRKEQIPADQAIWTITKTGDGVNVSVITKRVIIDREMDAGEEVTSLESPWLQALELKTFPNPAQDMLHLSFISPQVATMNLQVLGLNGQVYQQVEGKRVPQGPNLHALDVSDVPHGIFFLQIQLGQRLIVRKLIR